MNSPSCQFRTLFDMPVKELVQKHSLNIATSALFGVALWRLGITPELPAVLAFIFGGVLLSVIDWKVQRLPTRLIYLTLAGVGAGLLFASVVQREWVPLATAVAGGLLFANAFFLIWIVGRNLVGVMVIGLGDVRLALVLGLLLGWYGLPYVLYGAIAGNLLALVVVGALYLRKGSLQARYSFGPSLIAGTLAVVLFHG